MGLIGWIKKEIGPTSRQRRQSAPPPVPISLTSPNQHRDEAYMRAISKFNEWRNNQRFERLSETQNASGFTQAPPPDQSVITEHNFSMISDVVIDVDEKRRLIEMHRERKQQEVVTRHEHKVVLQGRNRLSLPNIKGSDAEEKPQKRRYRKSQIHPSTTIDEVEEFEQNHCRQMDNDFSMTVASPPDKFYRDNSIPYLDATKSREPPKRSLMGRNMLQRVKITGKGKAPNVGSETSSNFRSGSYKHYDVNSASVYDEFVISSRAYKGNMRSLQPEKINSVGESASSGSLSSDPDKNAKKLRRLSPPYQTVINKHGDEVEYAMPYNERDSLPPLPKTAPSAAAKIPTSQFEQIINENFQFLNSNLDFFNAEETLLNSQMDETDIDAAFSNIRRRHIQVTDLDKSNDTGLFGTPAQSEEIIKELDQLSKWTKKLQNCDKAQSPVDEYRAIQNNIKMFNSNNIKYKSGILRNSFSTPLELSTGYFGTTPVTLRSTLPNIYGINSFADVACKREFEILTEMKHQSIVVLMGISYDSDLRVMSLIMEPFDYTLNHYLHQMDQYFSIQETIMIVKQVACAAQYIHESGFIHSNISSHAVFIREDTLAVKLGSFELTTEILPRESLGKIFHPTHIEDYENLMLKEPADAAIAEKYFKLSKQHFYNRTSMPTLKNIDSEEETDYRLPYSVAYRRMFSMHYYQSPELLIPSNDANFKYVLPTTRSDTYALALLLWEALNHCVPFVVYSHDELTLAFKKDDAKLPLLNKSSSAFMEILDACLRVNSDERLSDVFKFIELLDEMQRAGDEKKLQKFPTIPEPIYSHKKLETKKNYLNAKMSEKVPEKIYFTKSENFDLQRRNENAITSDNLHQMGMKDSPRFSESAKSSEIEAHILSFNQQPGILQDGALDRIRKTVEEQRVIAPKKPIRKRDDPPETFETSRRSLTDSTMYQSFFDFDRLHTPKIDKNVIYERTSTVKKRLKANDRNQKKSIKGLFENQPTKDMNAVFDKMNSELNQIIRHDFMDEIVQELTDRQQSGKDEFGLTSFLNCGMANTLHDQSRSVEELPVAKPVEEQKIRRSGSENVGDLSSYKFSIDDSPLPKTPIARQNKIRRNAWLSDSKKPSGGRISDYGAKANKSAGNDLDVVNNSPISANSNRKQLNVSIKFHQNDLNKTPKDQNDSSINIKMYSPQGQKPSLVKVNNVELNNSRYNADLNKKYYPMMPEMLSDVIQNKRDRSGFLQVSQCEGGHFELRRQEREEVDENIIVPVRTSVREAIKFIESTFNGNKDVLDGGASPGRLHQRSPSADKFTTPTRSSQMTHEETQTEEFFTPSNDFGQFDGDRSGDCLLQASESIQRLNDNLQNQGPQIMPMPLIINKRWETVASQTPNKITTKVTVNLKKISRRSSDIANLKQVHEQSRHSISNNAELIKRIQMHFKSKQLPIADKNASFSASCSSLVPRDKRTELATPGKCQKYFCRNCGFTMLPTEVLQKIQSSGRISIASSLAEGLQSIGGLQSIEGSQSMATLRKCHPISETRSIEDLYIDDDFCLGVSQSLAANMELLPPPDFFNTLDFDFMSTEIFHTQEQEFDYTLNDGEAMQLDWHASDDEMEDEVFEVARQGMAIEEAVKGSKPNSNKDKMQQEDEPEVD